MSKWNEYLIAYKNKHQDKYDYSDTIFTKVKDKIRIYCNVHKVHFEQIARDHLTGTACIHCKSELISLNNKSRIKTDTSYLNEMNKIHNNKYTYNLLNKPTKTSDKITINCRVHGQFQQQLRNHLLGMGCKACSNANKPIKNDFLERANALELPVDYSKVNYVNMITDVTLVCLNCQYEWTCKPTYHLSYKKACLKCSQANIGWSKTSFNKRCNNDLGTLYIVEFSNETEKFYKIGITSKDVKSRYRDNRAKGNYTMKIILEQKMFPDIVWENECKLKRFIKNNKLHYIPTNKFGGSVTECFQCENINQFIIDNL